ncbi:hypothetical protein [Acinetobacter boissieri]|uniref:Uncharacterized protein n=1 Tax=Acinetobacter boissieri TaxID=1219383 RepID=A0A1G6GY34_9GAMM|nr:hypothetical protein [Acinetobacter boissieri]SDB86947.1 hypothetical protein SAMN05421733_10322 [Acinetobacter boissieri]
MTTKVLGEAVGIQWQGVQDHTQGQPSSNGVPLLIGSFKRGRIDKPMIIHNGNIRSELGYEPDRSDYLAVQSMLDMGVPNVNVLRVANGVNAVTYLEMSFGTIADADIGRIVVINLNGTDFSKLITSQDVIQYGNSLNNFISNIFNYFNLTNTISCYDDSGNGEGKEHLVFQNVTSQDAKMMIKVGDKVILPTVVFFAAVNSSL